MGRQLRSLDVAPHGSSSIQRKTPARKHEDPTRSRYDKKKQRRCRSRLKSSSFPSQCWLDRSPCSAWLPLRCPGTPRPSSPPPPHRPFYLQPPSPPSSPPTLAQLQQWWGARDQLHPRHPKISSWASRRKKKEDADEAPARKRANLDHLSPEERMLRRKLKNRVAAQTARDKKKAATDSMEKQLAEAQARLQDSLDANAQLLKTNTQLQMENANLQQQNNELQARLSPLCTLPLSPPASPLPSHTASSPSTPLSTVLSPPETAAGTGQEHDATVEELGPRVVVERLDSLGQSSGLDSGVCGIVGTQLPEAQPAPNLTLTFALSASSLEEETYPPVGL